MGNWDVELESSKNRVKTELNDAVSRGVFEQVMWERDVAIEQLKELGYGFGEKIRTDNDAISRRSALDRWDQLSVRGRTEFDQVLMTMPPVTPKQEPVNYPPCIDCNKKMDEIRRAYDKLKEQELSEDAISRQAVHEAITRWAGSMSVLIALPTREVIPLLDSIHELPSVTPKQRTDWIPITYRPATDEEKRDFAKRTGYDEEDIDDFLNCQLPEDGETVLITDRLGNVEVDTFINDCDGCYFECNCDMEDVRAWMPLPKPYDPQERSEE